MSDTNAFFGRLDDNDDVQRNPLGMLYVEPADFIDQSAAVKNAVDRGPRVWIYVKLASGVLAEGHVVGRGLGEVGYAACVKAPINSLASRCVGVAQGAVGHATAVRYCWLLRKGVGKVLADTGDIRVDEPIFVGNAVAGAVDSAAISSVNDIGRCLASASAAATGLCYVDCKG